MLTMSAPSRSLLSLALQINGGSGWEEGAGPFGRIDEAMRIFQHGARLFGAFPEDAASIFREFHRDMGRVLGGFPGVMLCALRSWAAFCSHRPCSCTARQLLWCLSALLSEVSSLRLGSPSLSSLLGTTRRLVSGPMHPSAAAAAVEPAATAQAACWAVLQVPAMPHLVRWPPHVLL